MGNNKIKFRNAMSGYNKQDVNNYIETLSERYYENEVEYQKKISELEKKVKELEAIEAERAEQEKERLELVEKLNESDRLIVELNGAIEEANSKNDELVKENAELSSKLSEFEKTGSANPEVLEKSNKYDQVSEQIGSMLIDAEARAESIVSEAEIKARVATRKMIDDTFYRLKAVNDKYSNGIVAKTVRMTETLRAMSLDVNSFCNDTEKNVESEMQGLIEQLEYSKRVITEGLND